MPRERVEVEWFADHLAAWDEGRSGVARDEQYRKARPLLSHGFGQLAAIHAVRQPDIRHQQVKPARLILHVQRAEAVFSFQYVITKLAQMFRCGSANVFLVIDQQQGLPNSGMLWVRRQC